MAEENKIPEAPEIKPEKTEKAKKVKARGAAPAEATAEVEAELTQEEAATAEGATEDDVVTEVPGQPEPEVSTQASVPEFSGKDAKPNARHPLSFELRVSKWRR